MKKITSIIIVVVLVVITGTLIYVNNKSSTLIGLQPTFPTGGESFKVGEAVKIQWKASAQYKTITLSLVQGTPNKCTAYTNNGSMSTCKMYVIDNVSNTGSYIWIVGSEKDINGGAAHSGGYVIRMQPDQDESRTVFSGYFRITTRL